MDTGIHDYQQRYGWMKASLLRAPLQRGIIEKVLAFDADLAARSYSLARRLKYLEILRTVGIALGKPFEAATRADLMNLVATLETKPYSVWTKHTYRVILKRFWKWLKGNDTFYPPEVEWIRANVPRNKLPLPRADDLLTEDEIRRMLDSARHPRNKAFLGVLWETGGRISEIGNLERPDVRFDKYGAVLNLTGKTGTRPVRIVQSAPLIAAWLSLHPDQNPKAKVWVSTAYKNRGQALQYNALRNIIIEISRAARIQKRVNPHSFRHGRASHLANHLTEFQMNQHFGWVQGSSMPSTYVHLSGRETDSALLRLSGITMDDRKHEQSPLKPQVCPRCELINSADSQFCRKCGAGFSVQAVMTADERMHVAEDSLAIALRNPDVRKAIQVVLSRVASTQETPRIPIP
jgi:integrase/recombinase XerD